MNKKLNWPRIAHLMKIGIIAALMVLDLLPGGGHGADHAAEVVSGDAAAQRPDGRLDQHRESVDVRRPAGHDEKSKRRLGK